jgi:membrane protein YqaA with SNARE-associated domain
MLRRLYDWTMSLARTRHAERSLAGVSFAESSFFPIPPEILLLAERTRWLRYAAVATIASVTGGLLGYFIGAVLFDTIGRPILEFYGYMSKFEEFQDSFHKWGLLIVFIFGGLTPLPYKVITIASGLTGLSLPVFVVSSILARGTRFMLVAGLLYLFGEPIRVFIEKHLGLLFTLFMVLLIGGFFAVGHIF